MIISQLPVSLFKLSPINHIPGKPCCRGSFNITQFDWWCVSSGGVAKWHFFFGKKKNDESSLDPLRQLNFTGLHFASRRLAFFFRRSIRAHMPLWAHPARLGRRSRHKAQIPMMQLASLFCHVGAAHVFVWLPVPLGSLPQRQGPALCDCLFSRPHSLALPFISNSHRVPPFTPPSLSSSTLPSIGSTVHSSVHPSILCGCIPLGRLFQFLKVKVVPVIPLSASSVFHLHVLRPLHPACLPPSTLSPLRALLPS